MCVDDEYAVTMNQIGVILSSYSQSSAAFTENRTEAEVIPDDSRVEENVPRTEAGSSSGADEASQTVGDDLEHMRAYKGNEYASEWCHGLNSFNERIQQ